MSYLRRVTDSFWNYVSPRKTVQRRDKPFKVPPLPQHPSAASATPSAQAKVQHWDVKTPPSGDFEDGDDTLLPPSPPQSLERPYTDFEGDTMIDEMVETLNSKEVDAYDVYDANEETLVVDEDRYIEERKARNKERERARQSVKAKELRSQGWPEDAIFLYTKLALRGHEPLFPFNWLDDFNTMPLDMFTRNQDKAYIKPITDDWRAQKALDDLLGLGARARDAVLTDAPLRTPELWIRRFVLRYNAWAERDGELAFPFPDLSLFDIVHGGKGVSPKKLETRILQKLSHRASQWSEAFALQASANASSSRRSSLSSEPTTPDVPTLYGIVTSHTVMAFVCYEPVAPKPFLRTVALFDFSQEGYDVWNALAIAIFCIHCRNRMIQLQEFLPNFVLDPDSDPDA
ncbi:hypothetical protein EJ04DRAFT_463485 [Polyplosphaeria fusca]|uniref:Uncharacterized protein n=1 Tax=Polyplosphaeria fusca TaxID=682080 RepID=A0A9P4R0Y8_9PLEO|nr:hypothetical protein EJ04DRAFT_463485 [Polyplosphaeria fusca]